MLQQLCETKRGLIGYQNITKAQDTLATRSKADKSHVLRELQLQQVFMQLFTFQGEQEKHSKDYSILYNY